MRVARLAMGYAGYVLTPGAFWTLMLTSVGGVLLLAVLTFAYSMGYVSFHGAGQ